MQSLHVRCWGNNGSRISVLRLVFRLARARGKLEHRRCRALPDLLALLTNQSPGEIVYACRRHVRHDRQREARRRYQATPRGRAMHAERNRRYRARMRCVTDHGPAKEPERRPSLNLDVGTALSQPAPSRKSLGLSFCDNCGRSASAFLRRSALRTRRHRESKRQIRSKASLLIRRP